MKIVVYSKTFLPTLGGLERNTHTLCRALLDIGHEVQLVTETPSVQDKDFPFRITRTSSWKKMRRIIQRADLFLVNGGVSLKVLILALLHGVEYGIIYHNYLAFRRPGNQWYSIRVRKWIAEHASINVFTSEHSLRLAGLERSPCTVLLNPVDVDLQPLYHSGGNADTTDGDDLIFLFAGRLIEGKGVFLLMSALERIDESGGKASRIRMVFAGTGPARSELEKKASQLSQVQVELPGKLDAAQLVEAYQKAVALVVPSTTHKEGNPLVIAEAIYAGTPVIASNQPPMVESVGQAGIIVQEGSQEDLRHAIESICDNPERHTVLKEQARERAQIFDYDAYKTKLGQIFNQ